MNSKHKNPKVDFYFTKAGKWQEELGQLRVIVLGTGLTEELKWGAPCYTFEGKNIVLLHTFKDYCAVLFFKGALLKDAAGILVQQTKNVQGPRQVRFTSMRDVVKVKSLLKSYIREAIELEKSGAKVKTVKGSELDVPEEFQDKMNATPGLEKAFRALTPGRQRAYILHFSGAKQSKTRASRVEKWVPVILKGKGLDD